MTSLYETLEFDVLRDHLADLTLSLLGRERVDDMRPFATLADIEKSQTQVSEFRSLLDYDQSPPFDDIVDLRPVMKKSRILNSMLQPDELAYLLRFLILIRRLTAYFSERHERIPTLKLITSELIPLKSLENKIATAIDVETNEVKTNASPELASIRKNIERAHSAVRKKMESLLKIYSASGMLQENLISVRNGRWVLVVKDEFRRKVKGLVHDQSATGSSFFIEPLTVVDDNNRIRELQTEEQKEIERILRHLTEDIRAEQNAIERNLVLYGDLDFIYAKTRLSQALNAFQPIVCEEPVLALALAFHPLLYLRMGKDVVPLDIELGEKSHTLIISGPNAGGKTVALKTVGLLVLMTLCGLHIPAQSHSRVGLLTSLFANIGDQQSLENDLSTFSSHLQALKEIAEKADDRSLVLIDEIGSGTDPEEGTALAIALLERLTERRALSIVTTHQSSLKAFAFETVGIDNASLEFDVTSLQPTYRFRTGIPGSSYAFEIAQRMGLPGDMTDRARTLVGAHKNRLEGLILELEERVQKYGQLERQAHLEETRYRGLVKLYTERKDALERNIKEIKHRAVLEAEALLSESNAAVEGAIREIRESHAQKEYVKKSREKLQIQKEKVENLKSILQTAQIAADSAHESIVKGDYVIWHNTGGSGQIIGDIDKKGRVLVQFGSGIKARVSLKELSKSRHAPQPAARVRFNVEADKRYSRELDIRGMTGEEAIKVLDQFLDQALLAGFHEVSIIHGKGSGKLRGHVGHYLDKHPHVISFRLGYWNEGDSGVTVIDLHGGAKEMDETKD
ncbi:endonuclease MutS2 [candidate division KSB1 bacterium]|nr:endonuclease MutS2 [candidate division KSB1 bacterium]